MTRTLSASLCRRVPWWAVCCLLAWLLLWAPPLARAAGPVPDTLLRIVQTGRIVLGARDSALPLSYLGPQGDFIGYHIDLCMRVVAALRQRLDLPQLKVMVVPTTLATRYALLNNGTVDIDCGHNAVNPGSLQQVLMAHATFLSHTRVMTRAEFQGRALAEFAGRPVGVIVGSTAVPALRARARDSPLKFTEVAGRTAGEVFQMLEQGRVEAAAFAEAYLMAWQMRGGEAQRWVLLDGVLRTEPVALMFRLEDERLHALANEVLAALMRSGDAARLYDKWFMQHVPGLPLPVGLPLGPGLQRLFNAPGSELAEL